MRRAFFNYQFNTKKCCADGHVADMRSATPHLESLHIQTPRAKEPDLDRPSEANVVESEGGRPFTDCSLEDGRLVSILEERKLEPEKCQRTLKTCTAFWYRCGYFLESGQSEQSFGATTRIVLSRHAPPVLRRRNTTQTSGMEYLNKYSTRFEDRTFPVPRNLKLPALLFICETMALNPLNKTRN